MEPMHVEFDPRKAGAGHVAVEKYLERVGAPFTVFQPLYMYGAYTAKDCEQWFIDRIARGRPVPIPAPGAPLDNTSMHRPAACTANTHADALPTAHFPRREHG